VGQPIRPSENTCLGAALGYLSRGIWPLFVKVLRGLCGGSQDAEGGTLTSSRNDYLHGHYSFVYYLS